MSNKLSLLPAIMAVLVFGCSKNQSSTRSTPDLISQAHAFFDKNTADTNNAVNSANYRATQSRSVTWDSATVQHYAGGDAVIVPISYGRNLYVSSKSAPGRLYRLRDVTSLVISRDSSGNFTQTVITFIPDSANSSTKSSGTWFIEDWQGNTIYSSTHSGTPLKPQPTSPSSSTKEADYIQGIQVCDELDGYNYSPEDPQGGVAWSETTCTTYGLAAEEPGAGLRAPGLGLLPPTRILLPLEVVVSPPHNIIANIQDYIKCFSNYGGSDHTYQVMVCIDQPDPGTREAWGITSTGVGGSSSGVNPVDVGHTYLVLSENFAGYSIVRNIGFYPLTSVYPWSTSAQGQLNDDDGHPFDISLTITVDNGQFFNILSYISQGNNTGNMYDLNTNNCTTEALHALEAGGINLPATVGSWMGGGLGYDPGDLGEDIRNMPLGSNMTRSTNYSAQPNQYNCN